ncbi:MAG: hypothetical protein WCJ37_02055 [Syntrophus sp. (in: bacteria)]|jgi:hypothetical protein
MDVMNLSDFQEMIDHEKERINEKRNMLLQRMGKSRAAKGLMAMTVSVDDVQAINNNIHNHKVNIQERGKVNA